MRQTVAEHSSSGQVPYVVPCGAEADQERRRLVAVRRYEILDSQRRLPSGVRVSPRR